MTKDEAMKQALEALKELVAQTEARLFAVKHDHVALQNAREAITAIKQARALDKKAENARELGLDYEPAQHEPMDFSSLLREAEEIVRQKPTWKRFIDGTPLSNDIAVWMTVFAQDVARRTFPPAQQEPVAWQPLPCPFCGHIGLDFADGETYRWGVASCGGCGASCGDVRREYPDKGEWHTEAIAEWNKRSPAAQRTWVGLSDEEIAQGNKESWVTEQAWQSAVWWAEAKLKEKNT